MNDALRQLWEQAFLTGQRALDAAAANGLLPATELSLYRARLAEQQKQIFSEPQQKER